MITDSTAEPNGSQTDEELSQQDLLSAYRAVKERNTQLEHNQRHGRRWLWISIIVLTLLLAAIDLVHWWWLDKQYGQDVSSSQDPVAGAQGDDPSTENLITVKSQPVSKHLGLVGKLAAGRTVNVTAPFASKIVSIEFNFGERVSQGQRLLQLDIANLDSKMRTAQISQAQAQEELDNLLAWSSNSEVTSARRALEDAKRKLADSRNKKKSDDDLFKGGIISHDELLASIRQLRSYQNALTAAQELLDSVLAKGSEKHIELAKMKLQNTNYDLGKIKTDISGANVLAPLSGVALRVSTSDADKTAAITVGSPVSAQQMLLSIGDMDSLKVDISVSELDINDIKPGLKVIITADNLEKKALAGKVSAVGNQVDASGNRDMAYYPVTVTVQALPAEVRDYIRLGMHVKLDIVIYDNPSSVVIPKSAVHGDSGDYTVKRFDQEKNKLISTPVEVGHSLASGIEILSGLTPGDRIAP